ncbi:hypothetical protein O9X98_10570 [Agrobacterium salinitolerans]|nr:hypothetical protein [Agrobacterium salinitolerans]
MIRSLPSIPSFDGALSAVKQTAATAHGIAATARDAVLDTKDTVVGYAETTVKTATSAFVAVKVAGLVVAAITAPIPTLVGLAVLALFAEHAQQVKHGIEEGVAQRKSERATARALSLLKSYGAIPRTAIIETDGLKLILDSETGTVSGTVRTGMFTTRELQSLSVDEVAELAANASGEPAEVLNAYLAYRRAA